MCLLLIKTELGGSCLGALLLGSQTPSIPRVTSEILAADIFLASFAWLCVLGLDLAILFWLIYYMDFSALC